jgi:hypothetical protein
MIFLAPGEFGRGGVLERLAVDVRAAVPADHPPTGTSALWRVGFRGREDRGEEQQNRIRMAMLRRMLESS